MDAERNGRIDWFFRQYVYGTGIPECQIQWQAEDAGGQWRTRGKVLESGVPEGWLDALALYVQVGGKTTRLGVLGIKEKESSFEITMPLKPGKMVLNYLEDTLAVIR